MGLRTAATAPTWWRIDTDPPDRWDWSGFDHPRHRFDPPSGRFRVRYAANDPVAAARERFPARRITPAASDLHLVRLEGPPAALHLTHQSNLDTLGLDDRVNTARLDQRMPGSGDPLLAVSQHLADAVYDWWATTPPPIVYRTRSVPAARSIAFTRSVTWAHVTAGHLRHASALLVALVTHHGFDVPEAWLERPSSDGCAATSARRDHTGDRSEWPMPRGACRAVRTPSATAWSDLTTLEHGGERYGACRWRVRGSGRRVCDAASATPQRCPAIPALHETDRGLRAEPATMICRWSTSTTTLPQTALPCWASAIRSSCSATSSVTVVVVHRSQTCAGTPRTTTIAAWMSSVRWVRLSGGGATSACRPVAVRASSDESRRRRALLLVVVAARGCRGVVVVGRAWRVGCLGLLRGPFSGSTWASALRVIAMLRCPSCSETTLTGIRSWDAGTLWPR